MRRRSLLTVLMLTALPLPFLGGCFTDPAAWIGVGASVFLGRLTAPTVTVQECYRNGVLIDCSELPE
ncbi:MAG: hypothetical protein PVJ57_11240 [Phycisphaerae bacterium]|jgi:hypothetical protein